MIEAEQFVEAARNHGFEWYAGVPCSFLTPFINYVINNDSVNYVSSANEGDAVATAAGAFLGGKRSIAMMQNSGLGNAVSPLTSLSYVFRIPQLIICTHRGAPGVKDEPQHALMGQITNELFDTMRIPWESFPQEADAIAPVLERAIKYMDEEGRPYGLIMQKGTVAKHPLKKTGIQRTTELKASRQCFMTGNTRPTRQAVLQRVVELTDDPGTVIIATTGFSGRELFAVKDRSNHLYMVGSMGCASSLGLGLALARPDLRVVVIDGDGAGLMRMGNFATIGTYGQNNLIHLLLDNEVHDSTGSQGTVSASIEFAGISQSSSYGTVMEGNDITLVDALLNETNVAGARFGHLKTQAGTIENLPRPDVTPEQVRERLMAFIDT